MKKRDPSLGMIIAAILAGASVASAFHSAVPIKPSDTTLPRETTYTSSVSSTSGGMSIKSINDVDDTVSRNTSTQKEETVSSVEDKTSSKPTENTSSQKEVSEKTSSVKTYIPIVEYFDESEETSSVQPVTKKIPETSKETYYDETEAVDELLEKTTSAPSQTEKPNTHSARTNAAAKPVSTQTTNASADTKVFAKDLKISTISVSCLKVEWQSDNPNRKFKLTVDTDAPYKENIYFAYKDNTTCYLTGLRENSKYTVTVTPEKMSSDDANVQLKALDITGKTEAVDVIYDFDEYEYDEDAHILCKENGEVMFDSNGNVMHSDYIYNNCWTSCVAFEKAPGLTAMPSSGAIAGSVADPVTGTGIRRDEYGDYCVAMGTYFGYCGDRFLIEFDNGQQITVKICDSKGDRAYHEFGSTGHCIIEAIHDGYNPPEGLMSTGNYASFSWNGLEFGNIVSIKKINYPSQQVQY